MKNCEGYDIEELKKMSKNEYINWYFTEMKKIFPLATPYIDYTIYDAEKSYKSL